MKISEFVSSTGLISGRSASAKLEHQGSDTAGLYFKEGKGKVLPRTGH